MWGILLTLSSLCKPQAIHKYHWEFGLELDEVEGKGFWDRCAKIYMNYMKSVVSSLCKIRGWTLWKT